MSELEVLYPAFIIMAGVYVLARIVNIQQAESEKKKFIEQELERRKRINDLYGRK